MSARAKRSDGLLVNRMLAAWDNSIYDQRCIPRRESAMAAALEVALAWERARIVEEIRLVVLDEARAGIERAALDADLSKYEPGLVAALAAIDELAKAEG